MPSFRISSPALRDLAEITTWLTRETGARIARQTEDHIFSTFERIATFPRIGHSRYDLTRRPVLFLFSRPYLVVYQPDPYPITIHAVLHSARNVASILEDRAI